MYWKGKRLWDKRFFFWKSILALRMERDCHLVISPTTTQKVTLGSYRVLNSRKSCKRKLQNSFPDLEKVWEIIKDKVWKNGTRLFFPGLQVL